MRGGQGVLAVDAEGEGQGGLAVDVECQGACREHSSVG